ncbi:hypothetical protein Nepgr_019330 [Nepenthes gracilis]|uniref:Jasmonate O-methyltransferase n=1 Tax=Nepenthes gracilis TaxID=150966 RepID=A0AAD3XUX5_NEPGR|nr:hypothetical protein Nepgr_019330 [Nepenthes gracilis]
MDVTRVFHVNSGDEETTYAKNSDMQKRALSLEKSFVEEALLDYLGGKDFPEKMVIADLGCSMGPNALTPTKEIIDVVRDQCRKLGRRSPEFMVYLNDLPGNDFNNIFTSLQPDFYSKMREEEQCCVAGVPGSFHGRLFLSKSLHFVHSSASLHWLSQVPSGLDAKSGAMLNKGNIYISKTSSKAVVDAYKQQFHKDFSLFLESRAKEVIPRGHMVLSFNGRESIDPIVEECCYPGELIAQSLMSMVSKGIIQEEKVDCFNMPYYTASIQEVKTIVEDEGSFIINRLEAMDLYWDIDGSCEGENALLSRGERVSRMLRSLLESTLSFHFGMELMDELFGRLSDIISNYLSNIKGKFVVLILSVTRQ